ncbi:MAG: hypothetical protein ACE14M_05075 [Terriglobales bacterium]
MSWKSLLFWLLVTLVGVLLLWHAEHIEHFTWIGVLGALLTLVGLGTALMHLAHRGQ